MHSTQHWALPATVICLCADFCDSSVLQVLVLSSGRLDGLHPCSYLCIARTTPAWPLTLSRKSELYAGTAWQRRSTDHNAFFHIQLPGADADLSAATYQIHDESHTIGNSLRWMLMKKCVFLFSSPSRSLAHTSIATVRRWNSVDTGEFPCPPSSIRERHFLCGQRQRSCGHFQRLLSRPFATGAPHRATTTRFDASRA